VQEARRLRIWRSVFLAAQWMLGSLKKRDCTLVLTLRIKGWRFPDDGEIKGFYGASSELPRVERSRRHFCKPPQLRSLLPYAFFPTSLFYLYVTPYTHPADPKNFPSYKGPLGLPRSYQLFSALNARSVIRLLSQLHCSDRSIPPRHPHPPPGGLKASKKEHQQRRAD
jgi:hypothetical protein